MPGFYNYFNPVNAGNIPAQQPILTTIPVVAPPVRPMVLEGSVTKDLFNWGIIKTIGKAIIGAGIDALKGYLGSKQGNNDYYLNNSGISTYNTNSNMIGDLQGVPLGALTPPNTKVDVNFKPFVPKKVNVNPPAYKFNTNDNQPDMSGNNAKAQKQTQINQQQLKPPDEKVINTASQNYNQFLNTHYQNNYTDNYQNWQNKTQQEIHAEMARYAAHPKYNDYVNEYYAKETSFVPNSAIAGLQELRRSVEAGAYARKMIDINRAEALQYFQDKYGVNIFGSELQIDYSIHKKNNIHNSRSANNVVNNKPDVRSKLETPEDTKNIELLRKSLQEQRKDIYYYDKKIGRFLYKKYPPDKTDLAILKNILQKAAKLAKNNPDKFMLYTDELLIGNEYPPILGIKPIFFNMSKRTTVHLSDTGWFRGYRDFTENQTFHTWSFVKIAYQYPNIASILNLYHEKYQKGIDPRGQTIEDYRISKVGIIIGTLLKEKILTPKQIADNIDIYLGTDAVYDKSWDNADIPSTPDPYDRELLPRAAYK